MAQTRTSICRMDKKAFRKDQRTGYLFAKVNPTKAGIFLYRDSKTGKIVRELRSRREVHKADSMASLENRPFGDDHPDELLDSSTAKAWTTGMVTGSHKIAKDGIHTEAEVVVMDEAHIKVIEAGKTAVSCGYECDIIDKPGVDPEFGEYDREQVNIKYDHLANVDRGRAGPGARLRADNADLNPRARFDAEEVEVDENGNIANDNPTKAPETKEKPKYMLHDVDGHKVDMSEPAIEAYETEKVKKDNALRSANERADSEKKRADKLDEDLKEAQRKATEAETKLDLALRVDHKAVLKARTALEQQAVSAGMKADRADAADDRELKETVIVSRLPYTGAELKSRNDTEIEILYEAAAKQTGSNSNTGRRSDARDRYDSSTGNTRQTLDGHDLDKDPMDDDF